MTNLIYRTTVPVVRINDQLTELSLDQRSIIVNHSSKFIGHTWVDPCLTVKNDDTQYKEDFLSNALIYLVSETVGDYPYPYLTEKTWKAIINQRPFMILGARGSLALLHDMGFKTFSPWWDESYDLKTNIGDRIDSIVSQLGILSKLSESEMLALEQEMLPTVIYNLNHLVEFKNQDLNNIAKLI